jgi:NAD(P)H-dependent FMN reductase
MAKLKIAIVISTTRAARFGHKPAQWVHDIAAQRGDIETEIIDLRDFPMPFFDEVASNAWAPSQNRIAQQWQKKVAEFDGFIFVTAEYNHGIPAVLKNALDYAYPEWVKKAAGFVGYGSVGGARGRAIAPGRGRAANGNHPQRCLYPGRRLHGGVEGRQGIEGHRPP